jgi:hypothetical protein
MENGIQDVNVALNPHFLSANSNRLLETCETKSIPISQLLNEALDRFELIRNEIRTLSAELYSVVRYHLAPNFAISHLLMIKLSSASHRIAQSDTKPTYIDRGLLQPLCYDSIALHPSPHNHETSPVLHRSAYGIEGS